MCLGKLVNRCGVKKHRKRNESSWNCYKFSSVGEMTVHHGHHSHDHGYSSTAPASHPGANVHIQLNPESERNYARLMQYNACYEAMPTSSKMVVFDTNLQLRKAFNGLIYQNTRHVLLSESEQEGGVVGILSVTDFIRVMLRLDRNRREAAKKMELEKNGGSDTKTENKDDVDSTGKVHEAGQNVEIEQPEDGRTKEENKRARTGTGAGAASLITNDDVGMLTIKEYRELIQKEGKLKELVSINADESLLEAARLLSKHRIHRLPVMDPLHGSPLFILTHKRILKFMWLFGQSLSIPDHHQKSCKELGVGTWTGIRVVFPDTPLIDCLDILLHKGVSGLPVVERHTFKVVDMYSRFDAIGVALEDKVNQLDVTVEEALAFRNTFRQEKDRVVSVLETDSLWTALTVLVERNVHRLCAVRQNGAIVGLISLSDVINYMVVKPGTGLSSSCPSHRRLNQHNSLSDELEAHSVLHRLEENTALLEQRATGQLDAQLAAISME